MFLQNNCVEHTILYKETQAPSKSVKIVIFS